MANEYKPLGQVGLSAASLTPVYTVPADTQAVVSSVVFANLAATPTTIRLSVAIAAEADAPKQYLAYDFSLPANDSLPFTIGITLGATDVIRAYAADGDVSVNVFGQEIT